jgi:Ubiquitin-activating enzyme E1 FCCH domain
MSYLSFASAVSRTIQTVPAITGATDASPIVITADAHGLLTNDIVQIAGVTGNTAANGQWVITVVNANTFSLNNSYGNAAYVSGGTITHIGIASPAVLIDNTVFSTVPPFALQLRFEAIPSGATVTGGFYGAADANFVTEQPVVVFSKAGAINVAPLSWLSNLAATPPGNSDDMFTAKNYDVPTLRIGSSGDNARTKLITNSGAGTVIQYSAWLAY